MSVYEALIGYKFHSWELDSENNGKQVNDLFQGYLRLLQCLKNVYKPKKGDKKKKDPNKTTQQTTTNTTLKKDGQKSSSLKSLKLPNTVLDFQVLSKIISFLHEYVKKKHFFNANVVFKANGFVDYSSSS